MAIFSAAVAAIGAVTTWFGTLSVVAQIGVRFAAGFAFNALSKALAGKPDAPREPGIVGELQQGADLPRSFLMGFRATAGSLAYHNQWGGAENEFYTRITVLSDLPIADLVEVWIEGKLYQLDKANPHPDYGWPIIGMSETITTTQRVADGFVEGGRAGGQPRFRLVDTESEEPYGWVKFYDGNQTVADSFVTSQVATEERPWSASEVGFGIAYAVSTFKINRTLFQGLPQILFVCNGIPLLDRSTGLTTHSNNPIVQADALLSGLSYGGQWFYGPQTGTRLNVSEISAEIAKCNAPVPGASAMTTAERVEAFGSATIPARYRSSMEVRLDRPVADVLEDIISACNGRISEVGTRYRVQVGDPEIAVLSITDANFRSTQGQSFAPFFPLAETVNAITATYPAPAEGWQSQDAPPLYRPDLEVDDGNRRLPTGVQLDAVPYPEQVQRLMTSALAEARRARRHSGVLPARLWRLEPGDFIEWSSARHGYSAKLWRVDGLSDLKNGDLAVDLTEVDPDDYDRDAKSEFRPVIAGSLSGVAAKPVELLDWGVEGVSVGVDDMLRPALQLSWRPQSNDQFTGISYQVRLTADQRIISSGLIAETGVGFDLISGALLPGVAYEARGRINTPQRSIWTAWIGATTPDIRLDLADLDALLSEKIVDTAERIEQVETFALQTQNTVEADARARVPADRIVEEALEQIGARVTSLMLRVNDTRSRIARAGIYVDEADGSVRIEGVKSIEGALFETQIAINEIAGQISLTATQEFVRSEVAGAILDPSQIPLLDDIVTQLNTVQLDLAAANAAITAKADVLTVAAQEVRLTGAELTIDGLQAAIDLKASATEVNEVAARVTTAEAELSALDGGSIVLATRDVRRLVDEGEALAIADLSGLLRTHEEGKARRADLASATLSLEAKVSEGREAQADLEIELAAAIEASEALVLTEQNARADALSAEASARQAVTARVSNLETGAAVTSASVSALATATSNADSALAQSVSTLQAQAGDLEADVSATAAALSNLETTSADADQALSQRTGTLEATVNNGATGLAATRADVETAETARADGDAALAQRATNLEATVNNGSTGLAATRATLSSLATSSASSDDALAQRATNLEATVNNGNTGLAATRGLIKSVESTRVTADGAVAAVEQQISASYGSLDAMASATSVASAGVDGLLAGYLWRARAGGVTGEVELVSNGVAAVFSVRADRFKFVGDLAQFFSDVEITGNLIVNGATSRTGFTADWTTQSLTSTTFTPITDEVVVDFENYVSASGAAMANNPVCVTFSMEIIPQQAVAGVIQIGLLGWNPSSGSFTTRNFSFNLARNFQWPAGSDNRRQTFTAMLLDPSTSNAEGSIPSTTRFKLAARIISGGTTEVQIKDLSVKMEQLNR